MTDEELMKRASLWSAKWKDQLSEQEREGLENSWILGYKAAEADRSQYQDILSIDKDAVSNCCKDGVICNVSFRCRKCRKPTILFLEGNTERLGFKITEKYSGK